MCGLAKAMKGLLIHHDFKDLKCRFFKKIILRDYAIEKSFLMQSQNHKCASPHFTPWLLMLFATEFSIFPSEILWLLGFFRALWRTYH